MFVKCAQRFSASEEAINSFICLDLHLYLLCVNAFKYLCLPRWTSLFVLRECNCVHVQLHGGGVVLFDTLPLLFYNHIDVQRGAAGRGTRSLWGQSDATCNLVVFRESRSLWKPQLANTNLLPPRLSWESQKETENISGQTWAILDARKCHLFIQSGPAMNSIIYKFIYIYAYIYLCIYICIYIHTPALSLPYHGGISSWLRQYVQLAFLWHGVISPT